MRLQLYAKGCILDELDRQARIFNESFYEAMTAALVDDDAEECWRHLQGALRAAIIVNRLVDPRNVLGWPGVNRAEATRIAEARAAMLRKMVLLPEPDPAYAVYAIRGIRNDMEHIDERLDSVTRDENDGGISDWYSSRGALMVSPEDIRRTEAPRGLRAFVPTAGFLFFNDESVNLFSLSPDMLAIRNNAAEARVPLEARMKGFMTFGSARLIQVWDVERRLAALQD